MPERELKIKLFKNWTRVTDMAGPPAFKRTGLPNAGVLQFSHAEFKGGELAEPGEEKLLEVCRSLASKIKNVTHSSTQSGTCDFGKFGTLVVRAASPAYFQVWVLSDSRDFILVTHTCAQQPDPVEIFEAHEIATMTKLTDRA